MCTVSFALQFHFLLYLAYWVFHLHLFLIQTYSDKIRQKVVQTFMLGRDNLILGFLVFIQRQEFLIKISQQDFSEIFVYQY